MTPRRLACLTMTAALTASATGALAATACANRTTVVERLASRYGETLQSMGLHRDNSVIEVYASNSTGTWTILVTRPDGVACLLASGEMWENHGAGEEPGEDV